MMIERIKENLSRQKMAVLLLQKLLEEEFSRLKDRNPKGVSPIELSIQELMRQLVREREALKVMVRSVVPDAERVEHILDAVEEGVSGEFAALVADIDVIQQSCGMQAAKNQQMVLALYDQSRSLLGFMHKAVQPPSTNSYSAKGRYAQEASQASLVSGRL